MKYTFEGEKNWDGNDLQAYKWAWITVTKENDVEAIAVRDLPKAMIAFVSAENLEEFDKRQLHIMRILDMKVLPDVL